MQLNRTHDDLSLSVVRSMLRLEKKYRLEVFRSLAVKALMAEFPRDLGSWEARYIDALTRLPTILPDLHPFEVVNLLYEAGVQSILPVALYSCIEIYQLVRIILSSCVLVS